MKTPPEEIPTPAHLIDCVENFLARGMILGLDRRASGTPADLVIVGSIQIIRPVSRLVLLESHQNWAFHGFLFESAHQLALHDNRLDPRDQ